MFGATAFCENAIAEQGVLQIGVAEMSGIASSSNAGVGILAGVAELSFNNTQTTAGIFISGSVNAEVSSNLTQTTENIRIVKEATSELSADLTQTSTGAGTFVGTSLQDLNFTKTSSGDIMFVDVVTDATTETYTEITPSGTETYTEVTPSGTETYTEIVR
jgi:hypothetical protein